MISETHVRLLQEKLDKTIVSKGSEWININMKKQLELENVSVWEINSNDRLLYRISAPGIRQSNYKHRVMIIGKQTEKHVLGQYMENNAIINMYNIEEYLSHEEQILYLKLLNSNRIRECIELLRYVEKELNSEKILKTKKLVK